MDIQDNDRKNEQGKRLSFDDVPVGQRSKQNDLFTQEHPPGFAAQQTVPQQLPLEKKIVSKIWKLRLAAYQELIDSCLKGEELICTYEDKIIAMLADNNMACQEKAFRLAEVYISKRPKIAVSIKELLKILFEKGLISAKNQILKAVHNCLVELFDKGYKAEIYYAVAEGLAHKNPKVAAASVQVCILLLNHFGLKRLDMLKPFLKELEPYLETNMLSLKTAIMNFYKEGYKWMGDAFIQFTNKFKKPMQDEFEKFVKEYVRVPMQPLRSNELHEVTNAKPLEIDSYSIADPVDVIGRYDENWTEKVLQIPKWSDKKDTLDAAIAQFSTPKLVNKEHYHLITMIKKLLADSNLNIQICALKLSRCLASGLRKPFSHSAKILAPLVIGKLKDKKNSITDEAQKTLKAFAYCIGLEELAEGIKEGLADKAPNMRIQILKLVSEFVSTGKKDPKAIKLILDNVIKMTADAASEVRTKASEVLLEIRDCYTMSIFGDKIKDIKCPNLQKSLVDKAIKKEHDVVPPVYVEPIKTQEHNNTNHSRRIDDTQAEPNIWHQNEAVRLQNYQMIVQRQLPNAINYIKTKGIKESSPNILRAILTVMERFHQSKELTRSDVEYLISHDWRKAKNFLSEYLNSVKLAADCLELTRINPLLKELIVKEVKSKAPLISEIYSWLPKMMSFQLYPRMQAADAILSMLQQTRSNEDYNVYVKQINELCNVIKCRINDNEPEVAKKYIEVARLFSKMGIANKTRGRVLLPTILSKISDNSVYHQVKQFMNENLELHPGHLMSHLPTLLNNEYLRPHLLFFIEQNIGTFIKTADIKSFLGVLFNCYRVPGDTSVRAGRILDSIVSTQTEVFVEKAIRELRLEPPESFLIKWNIEKKPPAVELTKPSLNRVPSKSERVRDEQLNPWPIIASPSHIFQLVSLLPLLPPPFCQMGTLLSVNYGLVQKLIDHPQLFEYSDIVVKWLFWRFQIQRKESVLLLMQLAKKMVVMELQEMELIILLSGLVGVVKLGPEVALSIGQLHMLFKANDQQKIVRFWINFARESPQFVEHVLLILRSSFKDIQYSELASLASQPGVKNNKEFLKYLLDNYDPKTLQVYGFDLDSTLSEHPKGNSENENTNNWLNIMLHHFNTMDTNEILTYLARQVYQRTPQQKAQFHLVLIPALQRSVVRQATKPQTFMAYLGYVTKDLPNIQVAGNAKALSKIIIDLLMELDEKKPDGHSEYIKLVNSLMLKLLDATESYQMITALFGLIREELKKGTEYSKTIAVMSKCMSKIVKNPSFAKMGLLPWYLEELTSMLDDFYSAQHSLDTPLIKVFRTMFKDSLVNFPQEECKRIMADILSRKSSSSCSRNMFQEYAGLQTSYSVLQDAAMGRLNMIKAKCGLDELKATTPIWEKKNMD